MSYIESTLSKDEKIKLICRPHRIIFAPAIGIIVLALVVWTYADTLFAANFTLFSFNVQSTLVTVIFLIALLSFIKAMITYQTSEYGVTNKRIIMKTGWIQRNSFEIFLDKIEAINVDQTVTGRALCYGTITIVGTGGSRDPFYNVPQPLQFRQAVQQQVS